jgi:hypothetical protein
MRRRILITLIATTVSSPLVGWAAGPAGASDHNDHGRSCYSTCPSRTSLSVSPNEVTFGSEGSAVFTATVSPREGGVPGTPTGTVVVKTGWSAVCTITLSGGTGSCSPGASALQGSHRPYLFYGAYSGDGSFYRSYSNIVALKVDPATSPPPPPHHRHHDPGRGWPWDLLDH